MHAPRPSSRAVIAVTGAALTLPTIGRDLHASLAQLEWAVVEPGAQEASLALRLAAIGIGIGLVLPNVVAR